jgi:hypothetical protein
MATSVLVKITCFFMLCLVLTIPLVNAGMTCNEVTDTLYPCAGYATTPGDDPPPAGCCGGIKAIKDKATTTPERQSVCECLKTSVLLIPGVNPDTVAALPEKCDVPLPYQIKADFDCSTYISHSHPSFFNFIYKHTYTHHTFFGLLTKIYVFISLISNMWSNKSNDIKLLS